MKDKVLFVDDDTDQCDLIKATLTRLGYHAVTTSCAEEALELLVSEDPQVVITDLAMGPVSGLDLTTQMLERSPKAVVIVLTGQASMETAVSTLRAGAFDFLTKPVDARVLALALERAMKHRALSDELSKLRAGIPGAKEGDIVGDSPVMRDVKDLTRRIAATDTSVLIQGETGTGKEVLARAIHAQSPRAKGPFIAINCAAVPMTLLESELFGHVAGAFTDARQPRRGLFLEASGGTLFLDEIGEMPLEMQAKLLRALQERSVRPIGGAGEHKFDARIIVATHRDLENEVRNRRFREDLYYRVNVVRVDLPPLRERGADLIALSERFLERANQRSNKEPLSLSLAAAKQLMKYDWPGNIRELQNCIEHAVTLARFDHITVEDLPEKVRAYNPGRLAVTAGDPAEVITIDQLERRYLTSVLKLLNGNKSKTAEVLGIDRRTLYRKLNAWEAERAAQAAAVAAAAE